jgi:hypothetical protein
LGQLPEISPVRARRQKESSEVFKKIIGGV